PGAEDRHDVHVRDVDHRPERLLERRLDLLLPRRKIARELVEHEPGDLVDGLLEELGRRAARAQDRELRLDERVREDAEVLVHSGNLAKSPDQRSRYCSLSFCSSSRSRRISSSREATSARKRSISAAGFAIEAAGGSAALEI